MNILIDKGVKKGRRHDNNGMSETMFTCIPFCSDRNQ